VLVEIGIVPAQVIEWLGGQLQTQLGLSISTSTPVSVPFDAFDHNRSQYRGEAVLDLLRNHPECGEKTILGVIDADCYGREQPFALGQAAHGELAGYVAIYRFKSSLYGLPEDMALLRNRILKQAIHVMGLAWGLPCCPRQRCVMYASKSIIETDLKTSGFCAQCRRMLSALPARPQMRLTESSAA